MSRPNFADAIASKAKVHDYLLSLMHPSGRSKARFFHQAGFIQSNWHLLAEALTHLACANEVVKVAPGYFGVKYTIEGVLSTPSDMRPKVRTVWIVEAAGMPPRLVTVHPLMKEAQDAGA